MPSWNLVQHDDHEYELLNGYRTAVVSSSACGLDVVKFMSRMEELDVPIGFTRNLESVRFQRSAGGLAAYYMNDEIVVAVNSRCPDSEKAFIHELAHHVEDEFGASEDWQLEREFKRSAKHIPDRYARQSVSEYLAVGFELYYAGTFENRKLMKHLNPVLWSKIRSLDRLCR